jgi:hypothetical protein
MFASFQNVLFVFDNGTDNDLAVYEYELYEEDDIVNPNTAPYALQSGATALKAGAGNSSVFAVPVEGSYIDVENNNVVVQKNFFGRVRAKDTSGNTGVWTAIVKTDPSTPLIDSQYIVSLTADKIKAGTIESAAIVLGGANPTNTIIKSLTYDTSSGAQGWFIRGDGHFSLGGPNGITYNNSTITIGSAVQVQANLAADSISVGSGQNQLNINDGINGGAGGMTLGDPAYNYWYANGNFRVGGPSSYLSWNGSALTVVGGGTFSGALSGGTIQIGSGENVFKADSNGIYLGNETFANAEFRVTPAGALTATNASITGTITSTSGTIGGLSIDSSGLYKSVGGNTTRLNSSSSTLDLYGLYADQYASAYLHPGRMNVLNYAGSTTITGNRIDTSEIFVTTVYSSDVGSHTMNIGGIAFPARINDGDIIPLSGQGPWRTNLQWTNGGGGRLYYQIDDNSAVKGYLTKTHLSDRRLKSNISQEVENWLNKFNQIKIYEFEYNNTVPQAGGYECIPDGVKKIGVIADEIQQLFPQYVLGTAKEETLIQSLEGKTQKEKEQLIEELDTPETTVKADGIYSKAEYQQVDYSSFVPLLMAVNLNQNKLIEQLSAKVEELQSRLV